MAGKKRNREELDDVKALLEYAKDRGAMSLDLIPCIVRMKSNEAIEINNDGLSAQIKYLYESVGKAETEMLIRQAARGK